MLRILDLRGVADVAAELPPRGNTEAGPTDAVEAILATVRANGDAGVRALTEQFDGVRLDSLQIPLSDCRAALERVDRPLRSALEAANDAIVRYHRAQLHAPVDIVRDGLRLRSYAQAVDRAGCYVPGGKAPLASSVLMTAAIAKVAGVPDVVLVSPPDRTLGRPVDAVLAAAAIAGVDEVYGIGGAQAIGALAYGTETVKPVDVIVGPGNIYVSIAKRIVAGEGRVGVPSSFAGPSEVVVIADGSVPARFAAIDVVLQAEHGPDGAAWLITWDERVADAVNAEIAAITLASPRRADLEANFAARGYVALVDGPEQAAVVSNLIAPEHLELLVENAEAMLKQIRHAGAVFIGPYSPASIGDYIAGPSHVLPTDRSARFGSALNVTDFQKHMHVVSADREGFAALAPHVIALAEAEGLPAHADSIRYRMDGNS
jgi:histidinol dehydrogenase